MICPDCTNLEVWSGASLKGGIILREWTREEKYRYLKDPQELMGLYDRIRASEYRQTFHNQAVTGLMNDDVLAFRPKE